MIELELRELDNIWCILPPEPDFVIVGEMHGSRQNAPLMQSFALALLTRAHRITIAFEWAVSDTELDMIGNYIHRGIKPERLSEFFLNSDGRVTYEHFDLLRWIRTYNAEHNDRIGVCTFDVPSSNGNTEQALANALLSHRMRQPKSLFLVETGNMHARKASYVFDKGERVPMAAILKETCSVFSVFLKYLTGKVLVEGMPRDVTKAVSQQESPEPYFDAIGRIPESQPASEITDLTNVIERLTV